MNVTHYFFELEAFGPFRVDLLFGDFRLFEPTVARFRAMWRILFLACRERTLRRLTGASARVDSRTFAVTFSGMAERFSVNSWVALANVPAACPSLRATVFRSGSRADLRFRAVIWAPSTELVLRWRAEPAMLMLNEE